MSTPDDLENVIKNRMAFFEHLEVNASQIVIPQQIHSPNVEIVNKSGICENTDALITKTPGIIFTTL